MSNLTAFQDMIGFSEGTLTNPNTKNGGYDVLYGGGIFTDYSDHPRQHITIGKRTSTAAGKYQILEHIFDAYKSELDLKDFSPASQDAIVIKMISERHALPDIQTGRIIEAIHQCANLWASFPTSPYGQPTQNLQVLLAAYQLVGGTLTTNGE